MKRQKRYWNSVMIMTCILCLVAALAYWIVPSVRAGTVPPIGGIIWHALAPFQLLITNVFRPFAYGIAPATSNWLELVILLLMTWGSILLISMVICLPLCFLQQRPWVNDDIEETSASSLSRSCVIQEEIKVSCKTSLQKTYVFPIRCSNLGQISKENRNDRVKETIRDQMS